MLYDLWVIITGAGVICFIAGVADFLRDFKNSDWKDLLLFLIGFLFLLIGAINASFLDFILPTGAIFTYNNEAVFTIPLFGASLVSVAFAMATIITSFLHRNELDIQL